VSPAAISGAVRYLIQLGILTREPIPGSRSDLYRLPGDTWYQSSAVKRGYFKVMIDLAQGGVDALGGPDSRAGTRVAEMRDFFSFMEAEMEDLLKKWEATRDR
jgi:DNA-binding transcriptional regulator GbsR (MarR family)